MAEIERRRLISRSKTFKKLIGLFSSTENPVPITAQDLAVIDTDVFNLTWALPNQDFEGGKYWGEALVSIPEVLRTALLVEKEMIAEVKFSLFIRRERANPKTRILASVNGWRISFDTIRGKDVVAVISGELTYQSRFFSVLEPLRFMIFLLTI